MTICLCCNSWMTEMEKEQIQLLNDSNSKSAGICGYTTWYFFFKRDRFPRVKWDHLSCHVVAQKLMLGENLGSGYLSLFIVPWTTSASFLSQCTNIILLLTKKTVNYSMWRACLKHFLFLLGWGCWIPSVFHYPQKDQWVLSKFCGRRSGQVLSEL